MKRTIFALLALFGASAVPAQAVACDRDCQRILLFGGAFALGRATAPRAAPQYPQAGYGQQPGYGGGYAGQQYATQPRVVRVPATVVHVDGARHLPGGGCVQSNGRVGVVQNGMCFVPD